MFKIYIITHKFIYPENIPTNIINNISAYVVSGYNVKNTDYCNLIKQIKTNKINYIEESKLVNYNATLQKNKYFAPTLLYHSHINNNIIADNKYIGMIEYDINFNLSNNESVFYNKNQNIDCKNFDFNNEIKKIIDLKKNENFFICFSVRHKLNFLYSQTTIRINNINWLHYFIEDYNKRYGKNYTVEKILKLYGDEMMPTQQSFLCNRIMFQKISKYVNEFINTHIEVKYTPFPATILERYIGMFIMLSECEKFYIPLKHKAIGYVSGYRYN